MSLAELPLFIMLFSGISLIIIGKRNNVANLKLFLWGIFVTTIAVMWFLVAFFTYRDYNFWIPKYYYQMIVAGIAFYFVFPKVEITLKKYLALSLISGVIGLIIFFTLPPPTIGNSDLIVIASNYFSFLGIALFCFSMGLIYFIPSFIGKKHRHFKKIFIINCLGGWTVILWFSALVWAILEPKKTEPLLNKVGNVFRKNDLSSQLRELGKLKEEGLLTEEEFDKKKQELLNNG